MIPLVLKRLGVPTPPQTPTEPRDDRPGKHARRGNCYVACEALYHLLIGTIGGRLVPHTVRHEGEVHWYLVLEHYAGHVGNDEVTGEIVIDPTASQFRRLPPYHRGRGRGFLTKHPSKRARALMEKLVWQEPKPGAARIKRRRT